MYSTGTDSNPFGMVVGDFDNDNQLDIAVVNSGTNNVLVLIGYSMMQSENPTAYSTGDNSLPYQIAMGDFNNDTQLDLAVCNSGTNNIGVFLGYGNGSFQEQITYSTGDYSRPYALTVSDLDNDHQLDIIVGNSDTESLGILYGYGNGTFATVVTYFTGDLSSHRWVTANDFNNDNHLDIAFADYGRNSIGIFLGYGNRTFGNLTTYSSGVGSRPFGLAVGDLNNDGRLDVAVACYGTGNIVIFLGSVNDTFTLSIIYSLGDGSLPNMVTIVDLNNDNHLDIIIADFGTNDVDVIFGSGNGSFGAYQTYSTGPSSKPYWVNVADLNNDDLLDLAAANSGTDNVGVFLGNRQGSFGNLTLYSTGFNSQPYSMAVSDFNRDNQLDIAVANTGTNNVAILLGHPSKTNVTENFSHENQSNFTIIKSINNDVPILLGDYYANFRSQTTYSTGSSSRPYSIAAGKLNHDTQTDIVVANSGSENLGILLKYSNGNFATEIFYSTGVGSSPRYVLIDDFNKDNQMDIAVTNPRNDSIIVLLGNNNGNFSTEMVYPTGFESNPSTLAIGSFNNNNYLDLVVANKGTDTIGIFFGFNYTLFAKQKPCEGGEDSGLTSVAIADFNNDGHLDIAAALYATNNVGVFLGYGNGTFAPIMIYANVPSAHSWSLAVGDFNNDSQLDITVACWGVDSIAVVFGYGNGSFTNPILYPTGSDSRPTSVAVGDFNNDNCLDITTANFGSNSITVFFGYGNGTFQKGIILSTGQDSRSVSVTVSDINNDTQLDIIVANEGTSNVCVFLGYGNGSFAEIVTSSTGADSTPWYAIAGDFNKDGLLDLVTANYGTGNIGVLYGYGNGSFGNLQTYATTIGSNPTNVNVGDFNNDNQLDIIFADEASSDIGVFFGYSDGTFASMSTISPDPGSVTYAVAIGDLNKDNYLDIIFANDGKSHVEVFLADGSKPFGGQTSFFVGENSSPSSVAVGYFNNDSQLDIATANSATNNIGILLGYGNRIFSDVITTSTGHDSSPMSLVVGDFNNDSLTDILVANSIANNIVMLMGYGNGSFSTWATYSMGEGSQPVSIAAGDFNRDSQLDIAVANYGTNNVCILFGYGNGTFTNQTCYPLGYDSRPNWVIFKDLNNDGWEDIAVVIYGMNNIKILLNLC